MERIRVLLVKLPGLLGEIITKIVAGEPDMEVVGEVADYGELLLTAREARVDAVVIGLEELELPSVCHDLLDESPRVKLLAVHGDGRHAFLYELQPKVVPIRDVSPGALVEALRNAVRAGIGR